MKQIPEKRGLKAEGQVPIPIEYQGIKFDEGFRADIIIEKKVVLELKSIETVNNAHKKQLLTYLKLTGLKLTGLKLEGRMAPPLPSLAEDPCFFLSYISYLP